MLRLRKVNVVPDKAGISVGGSITGGESAVWTEYKISDVKVRLEVRQIHLMPVLRGRWAGGASQ